MPLIHSKSPEAFKSNLKAEIHAGKPLKQSLAIAYNMKKKPKKMAAGGEMESGYLPDPEEHEVDDEPAISEDDKSLNQYMAHGGDIVDHIMKKRQMMSEGGRVANGGEDELSDMADGKPNNFDDLSLRDDLESTNSGATAGDFLGNEQEDEDRSDIIGRIMRQRSMKQRNPRPA